MPYHVCHIMELTMTTSDSPPLPVALEHQDEVFAAAFTTLQEAITHRAFPSASVAVTYRGKLIVLKALGYLTYDKAADSDLQSSTPNGGAPLLAPLTRKPAVSLSKSGNLTANPTAIFDLACLTKVVATPPM